MSDICKSNYKQFKRAYKTYKKHEGNEYARMDFVGFFTNLFMQRTKDNNARNKLQSIRGGRILPAAEASELIYQMMTEVQLDINNSGCSKYRKKYDKYTNRVALDLASAVANLVPTQTSRVSDHIHRGLVAQQLNPNTALTPERFKQFLKDVRDNREPTTNTTFNAKDVTVIMDKMFKLLAKALQCDVGTIRPLAVAVLEATDNKEEALRKYEKEIKKLAKYPPTFANLEGLLNFFLNILPNNKKFTEDGGKEKILQLVRDNPDKLESIYEFYKQLLLQSAISTTKFEVLYPSLIGKIQLLWYSMKHSDLFTPPLFDGNDIDTYLGQLIHAITKARNKLLGFMDTGCRDRWMKLEKQCENVVTYAQALDKMADEIYDFVVRQGFNQFKDKLMVLTQGKVLESVNALLENGKYKQLRAIIRPVVDELSSKFSDSDSESDQVINA